MIPAELNDLCNLAESMKRTNEGSPGKNKLKQITSSDSFPCYNCGNDQLLIAKCEVCRGRGYVSGSDPMVKLIERIIDCKMEMEENNRQTQKFRLIEDKDEVSSVTLQEEVHQDVQCDECSKMPIYGKRYRCTECKNFDLCQNCYITTSHPHKLYESNHKNTNKPQVFDKQTQRSMLLNSCRLSTTNRKSQF